MRYLKIGTILSSPLLFSSLLFFSLLHMTVSERGGLTAHQSSYPHTDFASVKFKMGVCVAKTQKKYVHSIRLFLINSLIKVIKLCEILLKQNVVKFIPGFFSYLNGTCTSTLVR